MASNKKTDDNLIIGLNSVGLSLGSIARLLAVHHTTITARLRILGIAPADTRRSFMEDIYNSMAPSQQEWLVEQLAGGRPVKDFIKSLIIKEYVSKNP